MDGKSEKKDTHWLDLLSRPWRKEDKRITVLWSTMGLYRKFWRHCHSLQQAVCALPRTVSDLPIWLFCFNPLTSIKKNYNVTWRYIYAGVCVPESTGTPDCFVNKNNYHLRHVLHFFGRDTVKCWYLANIKGYTLFDESCCLKPWWSKDPKFLTNLSIVATSLQTTRP